MLILLAATCWAGEAFGMWKLNPARSTLAGNEKSCDAPDRTAHARRGASLWTRSRRWAGVDFQHDLYFDGKARDFHDSACSGTQSSRRLDSQTVEILRECGSGAQIRLVRRAVQPGVLILEITEQQMGGRRSERRLFMEKR